MSTHVVTEFHAKPGRGDDVLPVFLELSPESRGRAGCEAISIRRNQRDPTTSWATPAGRRANHYEDYLAWRTQNGHTSRFDHMLSEPILIRYFDEIPFGPEPGTRAPD
jgi:hypothetical protein